MIRPLQEGVLSYSLRHRDTTRESYYRMHRLRCDFEADRRAGSKCLEEIPVECGPEIRGESTEVVSVIGYTPSGRRIRYGQIRKSRLWDRSNRR